MPDFELNPRFLLRGTKMGEYTIESPIDEGGQGVLYRVSRGSSVFTLKIATGRRAQASESDRNDSGDRFRREVATLLTVKHPNVVRPISFDWWPDVETGHLYFVMEHVEGDPVLRWQQKTHPSLRAICGVLLQAAGALRALHEHGILHRDLKSANLLVREDGTPVIVDFGLARQRSAWTLTTPENILGTKTHLSPDYCRHLKEHAEDEEQYVFQPTDDTHALGYIFYEMLVGRSPFDPEEFEQEWDLIGAIGKRVPTRPRELNPKVPPALDDIVMALLEKEGERRMDAPGLVAALEEALSEADAEWDVPFDTPNAPSPEEESDAPEEAPGEDLPRVTWKRPALAVIAALALAAVAALFVGGALHWRRAIPPAPAARPAEAPQEQPKPPTAEQGRPTVNDEMKPSAPAPEAAKPAKAPTKTAAAGRCMSMTAAGMVAAACVHVSTGTVAGDCSFAPTYEVPAPSPDFARMVLRNHAPLDETVLAGGSKLRIPPEMEVRLDSSNPEGVCKSGVSKDEPCPVWEGRIVLKSMEDLWAGAGKRSLLIGETHITSYKETREELTPGLRGQPPMRTTGRMTARITHLQTPDGALWPVCGVLYGADGQVGVQILAPEYYGPSAGAAWGQAKVRFFWPP